MLEVIPEFVLLLGVLALQPELAGPLAAGVLAAIEVHAPGAAKGEGSAASVRVLSLTCTGSFVVEATAPTGRVPVFGERVTELPVQLVGQRPGDAFPRHDEDDDDGVGAVVTRSLTHQTQQLLRLVRAANHPLCDGTPS